MLAPAGDRPQITLLGTVGVVRDGRQVPVGGVKNRAVLAMLALEVGDVVSDDRLRAGLWGDEPPPSAATTLRAYVSRLRATLGDVIERRGPGYLLTVPPETVDAWRFLRGTEAAARRRVRGDLRGAATALGDALGEWRGAPLADLLDVPFAAATAAHLDLDRVRAVEAWADLRLALGEHDAAIPWLRRQVTDQPSNERLTTQLMLALYRAGHQARALAVYRVLRETLVSEFGIQPGPAARDLQGRILRQDPSLDLRPVHAPAPQGNLGPPIDAFIGRRVERDRIGALLRRGRTVTLVGPSGVGKSRLALEVAREAAPRDGAWQVDLSGVDHEGSLATRVAQTLAIRDDPAVPTARTIGAAVAGRDILIVLDNAEHVLTACAELAGHLSSHVPVLVTSRRPLELPGEQVVAVEPLGVAREGRLAAPSDAAELFTVRAGASVVSRSPSCHDARLIERIVVAVGGVPLAIELAAARARQTPLDALADEIDRRDGTTLSWAIDALDPDERRTLGRLAVFRGGFELAAATTVCAGDVVGQLGALVRHALVVAEPSQDGTDRFRLLDSVRREAATLHAPDDAAAAADRHASAYLELAERGETGLRGADVSTWLARLDREQPNIRVAIERSLTAHPAVAGRLTAALGWYWFRRGHLHERRTVARALGAAADPPPALLARMHLSAIGLAYLAGDMAGMRGHLTPALEAARSAGDAGILARCVLYDSWASALTGDGEAAWRAATEGHRLAREAAAPDIEAEAAMTFGMLARAAGDLPLAAAHLTEASRLATNCHHSWADASATWIAGKVAMQRGDFADAVRLQRANLRRAVTDADPTGGLVTLHTLAATAASASRVEAGAELLGAVAGLGARIGFHPTRMDPFDAPAIEAMVRAALSADAFATAYERGRALTWEGAMAVADEVLDAAGPR